MNGGSVNSMKDSSISKLDETMLEPTDNISVESLWKNHLCEEVKPNISYIAPKNTEQVINKEQIFNSTHQTSNPPQKPTIVSDENRKMNPLPPHSSPLDSRRGHFSLMFTRH